MKNKGLFSHYSILFLSLTLGFLAAFSLPWLAYAQGLLAEIDPGIIYPAGNQVPAEERYYVSKSGDGSNGLSWTNAFTNVQDALRQASLDGGGDIWVAVGVYYPDEGIGQINDALTSTFKLTDNVALFGGFIPGDDAFSDRDWENNVTVLSGDIEGNDTTDPNGVVLTTTDITGENAYNVVTGNGVTKTAVIDGFTITAGYANSYVNPYSPVGGGMICRMCDAVLLNLIFSGNYADYQGGGVYNNQSSPLMTNTKFRGNSTVGWGGGLFNFKSNPEMYYVDFYDNSTADYSGGGMYNWESSPDMTNLLFSDNSSSSWGGGLYNFKSNPSITNAVFSGNFAVKNGGGLSNASSNPEMTNVTVAGNRSLEEGGGMYNLNSQQNVRNSIFYNNQAGGSTGTITSTIYNTGTSTTVVVNSLVEGSGGSDAWVLDSSFNNVGGNIDEDPLFTEIIDPAATPTELGNMRLQKGSPAIDAGGNALITGVDIDLDGQLRIADGDFDGIPIVDMGAYEYQIPYEYDGYLPFVYRQ